MGRICGSGLNDKGKPRGKRQSGDASEKNQDLKRGGDRKTEREHDRKQREKNKRRRKERREGNFPKKERKSCKGWSGTLWKKKKSETLPKRIRGQTREPSRPDGVGERRTKRFEKNTLQPLSISTRG